MIMNKYSATAKPAEQFADLEQQQRAVTMGMYLFLSTELLLFGGLFVACIQSRLIHSESFAVASSQLDLGLATVNTLVLTGSTLTMTLSEKSALCRRGFATIGYMVSTFVLGAVFLVIKAYEWRKEFHEGLVPLAQFSFDPENSLPHGAELFFNFYFALTGLHVVHLVIGLVLLGVGFGQIRQAVVNEKSQRYLKVVGLYWSFIDVIWLFIFSVLYLW
jgi:cytochrome c oxidase subunit 3